MELSGLKLSDIHPSQFYISLEKLRQVEKWFRPDDLSHFEPVPVKYLNGRIILQTAIHGRLPLTGRAWQRFLLCGMRTSLTGKHTSFVRMPAAAGAYIRYPICRIGLWTRMSTSIYGMTGAILCMKYWHCAEAALPYIRTTMVTEMNHDCITDKRNKKLYGQASGNGML